MLPFHLGLQARKIATAEVERGGGSWFGEKSGAPCSLCILIFAQRGY
ncbi:hypothetical protein CYA_2589 [Synechococcus sp. JA-3-3Ab]|nr:hypothetical protein CYA_2589 [Synechococcus sp. JA-3-3Ab]